MAGATPQPGAGPRVRNPLVVALDRPDLEGAEDLARRLEGAAGMLKVGLELFCANGPAAALRIRPHGPVFLDLKLHDIPTTVGRAARAPTRLEQTSVARCVRWAAVGGASDR